MDKGFVIMAQDTEKVSYTKCAKALELSIKKVMPNSNVTIITSDMLPHGNLGGYHNDWQVYDASPYDETIKLESDMIIPRTIEHWWDILSINDVVVSTNFGLGFCWHFPCSLNCSNTKKIINARIQILRKYKLIFNRLSRINNYNLEYDPQKGYSLLKIK